MIVYDGLKSEFLKSCESDSIAIEIEENILSKLGRHTPKSEFRSWENSLNYMYKVLNDNEIPNDVGIAIEFNIPQTSKRVDFIISGFDSSNEPNMVIVELKQWEGLKALDGVDALVETYTGGAVRKVVHPSYQAWSYAQLILDYNASVQDRRVKLHPCACLHNYIRHDNDPLDSKQYKDYLDEAPAFTKGHASDLRKFIKKSIIYGDKKEVLYLVDHGKIRPSKSLQNAIASMLKGNREFIMIDEQKVAYEEILRLSLQCQKDYKKRTVIVTGGPGTGKSVIAVNLLAELTARDQMVQYVSKNSAPRQVYLKKLKGIMRKSSVDNMFKGSGTYTETGLNVAHTLLVDEAHRLNEKSGMFHNRGENQIKEIIHSSFCSVFFIDESQRVTMDDIGSVEEIEKWAKEEESELFYLELQSQFRCNGSDGYLAWLDDVLDIRETANYDLEGIDYDIRVFDSPVEMWDTVNEKNKLANRARVLAGYCWEWLKSEQNNTNYHDIKIGDFEMSWNLGSGEPFAVSETSINEVGCIHTSQGLEFDYVGVIIGDDMRYENGKVVTDFTRRAKTDQSLKGIKKLYKENPELAKRRADEIIKNTYRTLLTRGMKGCYIYCTDKNMEEYLKKRLETCNDRKNYTAN
ncbi:hypothetical protein SAMN02910298_00252 [Pseudobutyrivibrio sp. YE44]|uniref:DUF2075 domain-containing protein n=1 Tax=Pseudobutyrivibrio sp. YE44 TaxID=1520802 RepID=UPI00088E80C7|nr:DUF2075 domain-containing protein [Pseudobutyrivibrio sp. YE44]SDB07545.1 hypothetical protein SAMN02910298_00252 [Pseudobutyrivibrio sp. YE44]